LRYRITVSFSEVSLLTVGGRIEETFDERQEGMLTMKENQIAASRRCKSEIRVSYGLCWRCADVITAAFQRGVITAPGNGIIDKDFVRSLEDRSV